MMWASTGHSSRNPRRLYRLAVQLLWDTCVRGAFHMVRCLVKKSFITLIHSVLQDWHGD